MTIIPGRVCNLMHLPTSDNEYASLLFLQAKYIYLLFSHLKGGHYSETEIGPVQEKNREKNLQSVITALQRNLQAERSKKRKILQVLRKIVPISFLIN